MSQFKVEMLDKSHDRDSFSCGVPVLDAYFKRTASQDAKRGYTKCFVATDNETGLVAGFFTLSAMNIQLSDLPEIQRKKLPKYPYVPCGLIGRLAVSTLFQGQRLGSALLVNALLRVANADMGVHAVIVDAKDAQAEAFYAKHGFHNLIGHQRKLFIPVETVRKLLAH